MPTAKFNQSSNSGKCPCGGDLPLDASSALCPACQMTVGMPPLPHEEEATLLDPARVADVMSKTAAGTREPLSGMSLRERFGGFEIIRPLGKGGMGAVYEAKHLESERRVALKLLDRSLDSPETRKRFLREGHLAASINHPNCVYIYGTEEIEGIPVISMELVGGGTLNDQVRQKGPFPIAAAVDTILQLICGLEAAHRAGILHRDIKPSNCFVDTDGTVKVGDFGLSISTLAREEANLTIAGTVMGTPAYSSPEQLRGDPLDLRSDIYSVGATLYFLLTGKTPFEAENVVKLIAVVLEKTPEPLEKLRREIPRALGRVVLQALQKQPEGRFKSYEEFQAALYPFSSVAPAVARLPARFSAGLIDVVLLCFLIIYLPPQFHALLHWLPASFYVVTVLPILYFGLAEGIWGATVGKAAVGLRLIRTNGDNPGLGLGILRALIFRVTPSIPLWFWLSLVGNSAADSLLWVVSNFVMFTLMFSTARARNGYSGWHDLLSQTRVVRQRKQAPSRALHIPNLDSSGPNPALPRLGPFSVVGSLGANSDWLDGYDPVLRRKVWIRKVPAGELPVSDALRVLGRAGRARWLAGCRMSNESWDAYAAPSGQPLAAIIRKPQPWAVVRYWLLDLAQEIEDGLRDGSAVAVFALDRVWITGEGRALLLDFPAPGASSASDALREPPLPGANFESAKTFLQSMAWACLWGVPPRSPSKEHYGEQAPPPTHARTFLLSLPAVETPHALIEKLEFLLSKVPRASRSVRFKVIIGCFSVPLVIWITLGVLGLQHQWANSSSDFLIGVICWVVFTIIPSLAAALIFGCGPLFRRMDLAVVNRAGAPASRFRVFCRAVIAWSPVLISSLLMAKVSNQLWSSGLIALLFCLFLAGAAYAVINPARGFQDRIAGTWIVPR